MQLFVIDWSVKNNEDQIFATKQFCQYLSQGKLNETIDRLELKFITHTSQNGSGVIICEANTTLVLFNIFRPWTENFNTEFNFRPALTNE